MCFYDSIAALVEQFMASVKVFEIYCKIIKDNITKCMTADGFLYVAFEFFVVLEVHLEFNGEMHIKSCSEIFAYHCFCVYVSSMVSF